MHFQHILASQELQQICNSCEAKICWKCIHLFKLVSTKCLYVREIGEKLLSTLLLISTSSCYFIYNARSMVVESWHMIFFSFIFCLFYFVLFFYIFFVYFLSFFIFIIFIFISFHFFLFHFILFLFHFISFRFLK